MNRLELLLLFIGVLECCRGCASASSEFVCESGSTQDGWCRDHKGGHDAEWRNGSAGVSWRSERQGDHYLRTAGWMA